MPAPADFELRHQRETFPCNQEATANRNLACAPPLTFNCHLLDEAGGISGSNTANGYGTHGGGAEARPLHAKRTKLFPAPGISRTRSASLGKTPRERFCNGAPHAVRRKIPARGRRLRSHSCLKFSGIK